jgi:hypothetical protein
MAKVVYNSEISFLPITLEKVKMKYKVLPGSGAGKDQTQRPYPFLEVESLLVDGRDVRWLLSSRQLQQLALDDYIKQTQGKEEE